MTQLHASQAQASAPTFPVFQLTAPATPAVFGTLFFEVTVSGAVQPVSGAAQPVASGWTLRLWPQARLGDATLEARPHGQTQAEQTQSGQTLGGLLSTLRAQGVNILGPVRLHR